jgi:hypothetical protein
MVPEALAVVIGQSSQPAAVTSAASSKHPGLSVALGRTAWPRLGVFHGRSRSFPPQAIIDPAFMPGNRTQAPRSRCSPAAASPRPSCFNRSQRIWRLPGHLVRRRQRRLLRRHRIKKRRHRTGLLVLRHSQRFGCHRWLAQQCFRVPARGGGWPFLLLQSAAESDMFIRIVHLKIAVVDQCGRRCRSYPAPLAQFTSSLKTQNARHAGDECSPVSARIARRPECEPVKLPALRT